MISTKTMRIWTTFGYLFVDDLYIGEKVISFNPKRGICEYDTIQAVEVKYTNCMGLGINAKSMRLVATPDHPLLIWNEQSKVLDKVPIEKIFMRSVPKNSCILNNALFEPYKRSQDLDDIKWSARIAATLANYRNAKLDIGNVARDLGGYEAQVWLDTFFHWNILRPVNNWMKSVRLTNSEVRDTIFNIAPRAGVGARRYIYKGKLLASITTDGAVYPLSSSWFKQTIQETVFDLTTRNGNVLARSSYGSFLIACNKGEE